MTVVVLGERTAVLLHLALSGGTLDIEQVVDPQLQSDLTMFMSCCGLHELRRVVKTSATLPKVIVVRQVRIVIYLTKLYPLYKSIVEPTTNRMFDSSILELKVIAAFLLCSKVLRP